jgi:hypothetical protein
MIHIHDLFGLLGVFLGVYCYARVQWHRDYAKELSYSVLNLISSAFLIFSLLHAWNLSSFVSNSTWFVLSIYGIYRCVKYMVRHPKETPE